jgi:hypothetical protein
MAKTDSAERNYSATEREALGANEALVPFQPFHLRFGGLCKFWQMDNGQFNSIRGESIGLDPADKIISLRAATTLLNG